jgi:4-hydroxy-tetrahydrodipicolinate reductase
VTYRSAIDELEISHNALSRDGFAAGAVLAAEFLHRRKGVYAMKDVLGLGEDTPPPAVGQGR